MLGFDENLVKKILKIPLECNVVVITGLGYPSTSAISSTIADGKRHLTNQHKRFDVEHLISWQTWGADH